MPIATSGPRYQSPRALALEKPIRATDVLSNTLRSHTAAPNDFTMHLHGATPPTAFAGIPARA